MVNTAVFIILLFCIKQLFNSADAGHLTFSPTTAKKRHCSHLAIRLFAGQHEIRSRIRAFTLWAVALAVKGHHQKSESPLTFVPKNHRLAPLVLRERERVQVAIAIGLPYPQLASIKRLPNKGTSAAFKLRALYLRGRSGAHTSISIFGDV